ncbi:MAG: hypothetical protein ACRYFX_15140 [Janthinobacterium lividum]
MKQLTGASILLLSVVLAGLLVLRIWGVVPVSGPALLRSGATLLGALLVVLVIGWFAFFNNPSAGYDAQMGNRAHPRQGPKRPSTDSRS